MSRKWTYLGLTAIAFLSGCATRQAPPAAVKIGAKDAAAKRPTSRPAVSQQEAAATQPSEARIEQLIAQLSDRQYKRRQHAQQELVRIGAPACAALRVAAGDSDPERALRAKNALGEIIQRAAVLRLEYRKAAEDAVQRGDLAGATRLYKKLLKLPEAELQDCQAAIRFFEGQQDWASLAPAYEVTARTMKRIIHTPPEKFIRPPAEVSPNIRGLPPGVQLHLHGPANGRILETLGRGGGLEVQRDLDGQWHRTGNSRERLLAEVKRKQEEMIGRRHTILCKLARLYRDKLGPPKKSAEAFARSLDGNPFVTDPLAKVIARIWPVRSKELEELRDPMERGRWARLADLLDEVSQVQDQAGQLDAAIDTETRAVLAAFVNERKHIAHKTGRYTRRLWALVRRLPPEAPLPPTLWLNVLSRENPTVTFDLSKGTPLPGYLSPFLLAVRHGDILDTLELSADLEGQGERASIICESIIDGRANSYGWLLWRPGSVKKREQIRKTFKVPTQALIIRLISSNRGVKDLRIRWIKVKATFQPKPKAKPPVASTGRAGR